MTNRQQVLVALTTNPQSPNPLSGRMVNPPAYIGVPWVGSVWGVDGAHGYGYSVVSKPSWMSTSVVTGRNTILSCTGTPTASGALVVDITDAASTTVRKSFYINVRSALKGGYGEPIRIPPAFGGSPYSLDLKTYLNNPTLPLTSATVTTGSLPLGMSLSSDAVISTLSAPSPTTATVNVTIVDGASKTIVLPLTLVIQAGLTVSTTSLPAAVIGNNYYAKLGISGGSGEYSVVALTPLSTVAPGLSLNSSTAEITGVATQLSPTSGALTTQFVVTDKVTGQQVTTSAIPLSVNSSVPPASPGSFVVVGSDGSGQSVDYLGTYFGDGSDGDVTISSGTTTLTRDMYYNNLTISGTGNIFVSAQGWDIYVAGVLDLSNAPQYAIWADGGSGLGVRSADAGPYATAGGTGGTGATGAGGSGVGATDVAVGGGGSGGIGGGGGAAGDGGAGTSGAGGSSGVSGAVTNPVRKRPFTSGDLFSQPSGVVPVGAGAGGGGGGGGGGNGLGAGGNGGAGGGGGGRLRIFARTINRGASTAAGAISARGSGGINGTAGASSNRGGGGGGIGGGGGMIRLVYVTLTGATATNAIDAGGGAGGNGGNSGGGSGVAGKGGSGGAGGSIIINDLATPETTVINGSAGSINSGQTGGAGGICRSDL